jgi:hypothetical protein
MSKKEDAKMLVAVVKEAHARIKRELAVQKMAAALAPALFTGSGAEKSASEDDKKSKGKGGARMRIRVPKGSRVRITMRKKSYDQLEAKLRARGMSKAAASRAAPILVKLAGRVPNPTALAKAIGRQDYGRSKEAYMPAARATWEGVKRLGGRAKDLGGRAAEALKPTGEALAEAASTPLTLGDAVLGTGAYYGGKKLHGALSGAPKPDAA